MEPVVVAAIAAAGPTIAALAQWADMRRRTNGKGPIAAELKEIKAEQARHGERLTGIEERAARTEERTARMETYLAREARARRNRSN